MSQQIMTVVSAVLDDEEFFGDSISLRNADVLPAGDNILTLNREFIHSIEENEIVDDGGLAATLTTINTGVTAHKANTTTNIKAPVGSSLLIMGLRLIFTGHGGGITGTYVIRGTTTADSLGTGADDISQSMFASSNGSPRRSAPLILPAGRFLTIVKTAFGIVDNGNINMDRIISIGSEAF